MLGKREWNSVGFFVLRDVPVFQKKRGYPDSAVTTGKHRAQEIDRETALQASQNEETNRIPFTLTYYPQNLAIKNDILKNNKAAQMRPDQSRAILIFLLAPTTT